MHVIDNNDTTDPAVNLSIEEYCLRNLDPKKDYVLFYINDASVIIGRNQNPFQEVDRGYAKKKGIHIKRRISGGGAVYHDHGNLNFSFITAFGKDGLKVFKNLLEPILFALDATGPTPELMKNNTIFIKGRKISGNAQFTNLNRMLSHGTLLYDADLTALDHVLRSTVDIVSSNGVSSVRSRVTNISEHVGTPINIHRFKQKLLKSLDTYYGGLVSHDLTDKDWGEIIGLAESKYRSWEWNYGNTPTYTVRHSLDGNFLRFQVHRGCIRKIQHEGCGRERVSMLKTKLMGKRYDPEEMDCLLASD